MFPEALLVTCEHASSRVPARYKSAFSSKAAQAALLSHRGYDAGALSLARGLTRQASLGLFVGNVTRLLVDLNRTQRNPALFSEWSKQLPEEDRARLMESHRHHAALIESRLREVPRSQRAYHLAVHSFTPVFNGKRRTTDIGLLYDPARGGEARWVRGFAQQLRARSDFRVHLNQPYRGTSDGLTTSLRKKLRDGRYAGIEIEVNQRLLESPADARAMKRLFDAALSDSLLP